MKPIRETLKESNGVWNYKRGSHVINFFSGAFGVLRVFGIRKNRIVIEEGNGDTQLVESQGIPLTISLFRCPVIFPFSRFPIFPFSRFPVIRSDSTIPMCLLGTT
jgi:hypothetical protein